MKENIWIWVFLFGMFIWYTKAVINVFEKVDMKEKKEKLLEGISKLSDMIGTETAIKIYLGIGITILVFFVFIECSFLYLAWQTIQSKMSYYIMIVGFLYFVVNAVYGSKKYGKFILDENYIGKTRPIILSFTVNSAQLVYFFYFLYCFLGN